MTFTVRFVGGPRDGHTTAFPENPRMMGCADRCRAQRKDLGVYITNPLHWRRPEVTGGDAIWYVSPGQRGRYGDWGARWSIRPWSLAGGTVVRR